MFDCLTVCVGWERVSHVLLIRVALRGRESRETFCFVFVFICARDEKKNFVDVRDTHGTISHALNPLRSALTFGRKKILDYVRFSFRFFSLLLFCSFLLRFLCNGMHGRTGFCIVMDMKCFVQMNCGCASLERRLEGAQPVGGWMKIACDIFLCHFERILSKKDFFTCQEKFKKQFLGIFENLIFINDFFPF